MKTMKLSRVLRRIIFILAVLVAAVLLLFPFYWMVNTSFKAEPQLIMTPATFVPRSPDTDRLFLSLVNFAAVVRSAQVIRGLYNSVVVAGLTTLFALGVGSFAAFALGKLRFRGKTVVLYLILIMTMFPQISVLSGLYTFINWTNLPARPSLVMSYMIFSLPFTVWVQTAYFRNIPAALLQSAYVDGATPFQSFALVMLPIAAPTLVTAGLLVFINAWNEYLFALTFTSIAPSSRTIPVVIALFHGEFAFQEPFGQIMAAGVTVTVPLVVLVFLFQRRIIAGLTAGAVKG